jgi:putative ABC transport system substrate-binding protein
MTGLVDALRGALANLGWREGANLKLDLRWANNSADRARAYARELVSLKPDVIVAPATSLPSVSEATHSIPIVFTLIVDPVGQGFVSGLAHPGGNITGFSYMGFSTGAKLVELLKEIAPGLTRVLVLLDADNYAAPKWWDAIGSTARALGYEPRKALLRVDAEIDATLHSFAQEQGGGLVVPPQSLFGAHRERLIAAAAREHLPAVYGMPSVVRNGGLLSYSSDPVDQFTRAASYVDRILKGEKPGNLPIQEPTKYLLIVNLRTARTLGLTVPPLLLARADEVIE